MNGVIMEDCVSEVSGTPSRMIFFAIIGSVNFILGAVEEPLKL